MMEIRIEDFSTTPLMRHCAVSEFSGEEYYHKVLNEAFKNALDSNESLEVILDGVDGYSPSFIDEVFGNLVYDFSKKVVSKNILIVSNEEPEWVDSIQDETFPQWEERRKNGDQPLVTIAHDAWWRMNIDGDLEKKVWRLPADG